MNTNRKIARIAGFLYLAYIIVTVIANGLGRASIIVPASAAATVANILAHETQFRIGLVCELLATLLFFLTAWGLYCLLKPVNKTIALLFVLLNLCGGAIASLSALFLCAALPFASGAGYLASFSTQQLNALALFFLGFRNTAFTGAQLFYGAWTLPLGYLVFKSGFLPRALGILLVIDCLAVLIWFLQYFVFPGYAVVSYPCCAVSLIAELGLTLWLLTKGVRD